MEEQHIEIERPFAVVAVAYRGREKSDGHQSHQGVCRIHPQRRPGVTVIS